MSRAAGGPNCNHIVEETTERFGSGKLGHPAIERSSPTCTPRTTGYPGRDGLDDARERDGGRSVRRWRSASAWAQGRCRDSERCRAGREAPRTACPRSLGATRHCPLEVLDGVRLTVEVAHLGELIGDRVALLGQAPVRLPVGAEHAAESVARLREERGLSVLACWFGAPAGPYVAW